MNYTTHNTHDINVNRSNFKGQITCPFSLLITLFGQPEAGDGETSDAQWSIEFDDGVIATLYNWKNGISYGGRLAPQVEQITKWNIGGFDIAAVDHVKNILISQEIAA